MTVRNSRGAPCRRLRNAPSDYTYISASKNSPILHVYKGPRRNESSSRAKAAELAGSCRWDLYEHLVVCGTLQVELLVQICLRHTRAHHEVFLPDRENQARQRPVSDREGIIQKSRNR